MWQFLLGLFIGANISFFIYAIIFANTRGEKKYEYDDESTFK